ncbi:CRM-domain containing factor CFM2, chloroplastic [Arachis stenosperma]|uniref:CRM-domain containing factor CFM2, chloroplastic n=1 Tax=Arachis stenosperma TaxID=217475 RepID=UPI0025AC991D|nr:CRM-domain containing factor CFM2, chloroplastic [Arachis stenosperma]
MQMQMQMLLPQPTPSHFHTPLPLSSSASSFFFFHLPKRTRKPKFLIRCSKLEPATDAQTLPTSAIQRIADKLRSLGFVDQAPASSGASPPSSSSAAVTAGEIFVPLPTRLPIQRVGHTIDPSWSTPENPVPVPGIALLRQNELAKKKENAEEKRRRAREEARERAPTLAELSLSDAEIRRLTTAGLGMKQKLKIGKAGITEGIVQGIHERWRRSEVVRIVCEDICKLNMKRTHDLLERKTGGLVVWRSGSKILLYRGVNYKYPYFLSDEVFGHKNIDDALQLSEHSDDKDFDERQSHASKMNLVTNADQRSDIKAAKPALIKGVGNLNKVRFELPGEVELAADADQLLIGLGPRFTDWWGYDPLPVDADLLPAVIPGYRKPFRLLPYGVKSKLTDDEMTTLRRLGKPLPCHFALGRNRKHQGLAAAIIKLWERCEIVKIAIKRGVQNTNSEIMAEEIKHLTGGTLLARDREFIVLYRGKDFLPSAVSSAIDERRNIELSKLKAESSSSVTVTPGQKHGAIECVSEGSGTTSQKGTAIVEQGMFTDAEATIKRNSIKLSMALERKAKAEKLLAELENAECPQEKEIDKEGITEEERYMLRKIGLKMKPFLLLGRRGVFDGTVENMHLHWKYRELVKIICNKQSPEAIHQIAQTLEAESGGILIAVERVNKGYAVIVYRGKNYSRPASLRPKTLLNKKAALKRFLEAQRRESLKLHVLKLDKNIKDLKLKMDKDKEANSKHEAEEMRVDMGSFSNSVNLNSLKEVSIENQESRQKQMIDDDGTRQGEEESMSDLIIEKTQLDGVIVSAVDTRHGISNNNPPESYVTSSKCDPEPSVPVINRSSKGLPIRPVYLSNRERLLLRRQALKMTKRPVLAIGKSNIVTGVAKAIKTHFQKHPLAIVNIKGRAKGTSVQEVVFKLEQATGAVLVSREPNKVILYRGWGAGEKPRTKINDIEVEEGETSKPTVSPELLEAIKVECGLLRVMKS